MGMGRCLFPQSLFGGLDEFAEGFVFSALLYIGEIVEFGFFS
jgi:hypothetical protein